MRLPRRQFLHLMASAVALQAMSQVAKPEEAYPTRPVRIIVGYAPGGATDLAARLIAQWLHDRLGAPFVVENRPGAATNIATEAVVRAPPDGYTLLQISAANTVNESLYDNLDFNFLRDIVPIGSVMQMPNVMEVNPSFPAKTVSDFIAYARANRGKVNFAYAGGSVQMAAELFKMMTDINMIGVPYRGTAPALIDLISGQVQVMFDNLSVSLGSIRAGKVRALAVTTSKRSDALPEVPTVGSFVPGYEASAIFGLGAPRMTSPVIVDKLNTEINAALANAEFKARLAQFDGMVLPGTPAEFGELLANETEKWAKVVKVAGLRPE